MYSESHAWDRCILHGSHRESKVSWPDKALDMCKIDHNMYMGLERPIKQDRGVFVYAGKDTGHRPMLIRCLTFHKRGQLVQLNLLTYRFSPDMSSLPPGGFGEQSVVHVWSAPSIAHIA